MSTTPRRLLLAASLALLAVGVICAPAFAEAPWWHLTSGSRPAYLKAGVAQNEVQRLTVHGAPGEEFALANLTRHQFEESEFENEKGEPRYTILPYGASALEVQQGLEGGGLYGPGNVEVIEEAANTYLISFKGGLANQPVGPLFTGVSEFFGSVELAVSEVSKGRPDGEIYVTAENLGDASIAGDNVPVKLADVLPAGLKAVGIAGTKPHREASFSNPREPLPCVLEESGARGSCTLSGALAPYDQLELRLAVVVQGTVAEPNEVSVSGGEGFRCRPVAPGTGLFSDSGCTVESGGGTFERSSIGPVAAAQLGRPVTISSSPVPFGVEEYELANEEEGGAPTTQAGAHAFQQTTSITLNQTADTGPLENPGHQPHVNPAALAKDVHFKWPAGLIGNPSAFPQCTDEQFFAVVDGIATACPPQSAVGVATVTINEPSFLGVAQIPVPLFNLKPHVGEPARFGFNVVEGKAPVVIDTSVRTGGDYGVTVSVDNITQTAAFLSSKVTVWGVPGDPRHDRQRGWACLRESEGFIRNVGSELAPCGSSSEQHPPPFLSLPTSCTGPLQSSVEGDSWSEPGRFSKLAEDAMPALDSCNRLPFSAEIHVAPDGQDASTPTGLKVDVHVPQEEDLNGAGLASSNIRDIRVLLPEGVTLNPAAADGLQACSEDQIGYLPAQSSPPRELHFTEKLPDPLLQGLNFCPDAAKVGTAKITTPLLPKGDSLEGAVYLATPAPNEEDANNPFRSTVAMYIEAKDPVSGALVKLPGRVALNQQTGRIESTFENNPQLAFEDAELHFFGGARAPLATPATCGTKTTEATFTPWSGSPPVKSSSSFQITSGPNGSACPGPALPFTPSLAAGSPNNNAGSFSPLTTTISRDDGNQNIQTVQLHMAPGMSGILAGVPLCPEAQANEGTCGPESQIGETIVSVGLGGDPFSVTGGKVYLTEKYAGAPFGLSIVNPADAGPFHLGKVIVRAKIEIDPTTAALTITTGEIPHILKGIPLQIKHVNVNINRPGFTFNPTNCNPLGITGAIGAVEGATSPVSTPFQVTNCAALKFTPTVAVTTAGKASKPNGASLHFKIAYPHGALGSQSWFNEAKFTLPKQLPARLTTIQKACDSKIFEGNRAVCPAGSKIGTAIVHTPVLPVPLTGPVYFVSYGGAQFPEAVLVLDGYGVHIELHGETFISESGVTSATFRNTPDVPFESIEVTLPTGQFSEFGANLPHQSYSFCGQKLVMPTLFKAQNGLEIHQNTPVSVTGCAKAKTRAQKLKAALKACKKKKNNAKRAACVRQAHRKYAPIKKKK